MTIHSHNCNLTSDELNPDNYDFTLDQAVHCYDNVVVERFFGCLKYEWLANVIYLTRDEIINDVNKYIRYYNGTRLHATLDYQTPNEYEKSQIKVCN